jgi:dsRNA-gated channel SID-1
MLSQTLVTLLLVALPLLSTCNAQTLNDRVELFNNTFIETAVSEALSGFYLNVSAICNNDVPDWLVALEIVVLSRQNSTVEQATGDVSLAVQTDSYDFLGTVEAVLGGGRDALLGFELPTRGMFCWGEAVSPTAPRAYLIDAQGNPDVLFRMRVTLLRRALNVGVALEDSVAFAEHFFYVDIDDAWVDEAPLEVGIDVLNFDDRGAIVAQLGQLGALENPLGMLSLFSGCPGHLSSNQRLLQPGAALLTFEEKATLTVARRAPQLTAGRWFVRVAFQSAVYDLVTNFTVRAGRGQAYDDRNAIWGYTALASIVACAAICGITLTLVWSVQPTPLRHWRRKNVSSPTAAGALGVDMRHSAAESDPDDEGAGDSSASSTFVRDGDSNRRILAVHGSEYGVIAASTMLGDDRHSSLSSLDDDDSEQYDSDWSTSTSSASSGADERKAAAADDDSIYLLGGDRNGDGGALRKRRRRSKRRPGVGRYSDDFEFGYDNPDGDIAERAHTHFWQLTVIVGVVFFVPALQIVLRDVYEQGDGNRDVCFVNDECVRPIHVNDLLVLGWNNVYSNITYVIAALTATLYFSLLRYKFGHWHKFVPYSYSIIWAMCLCILFVGINSSAYHLCPTRAGFQIDSAFMLSFAVLSMVDIYRRYFSLRLHAWRPYLIIAVLLFVNYLGTVLDTAPLTRDLEWPKVLFRVLLTIVALAIGGVLQLMIWRNMSKRRPRRTYALLVLLLVAPTVGLLWIGTDADLSQSLLAIFISLFAVTVVADFMAQLGASRLIERGRLPRACRWCPHGRRSSCFHDPSAWRRFRVAVLALFLFFGWATSGLVGLYYFSVKGDSNKDLAPSESRALASPCVLADYYSSHDVWHFLSAIFLLFQILISGTIMASSSRFVDL